MKERLKFLKKFHYVIAQILLIILSLFRDLYGTIESPQFPLYYPRNKENQNIKSRINTPKSLEACKPLTHSTT